MKLVTTFKTCIITALLPSSFCFAAEVPSNSLQVEYKKKGQQQITDISLLSLDAVYQIPAKTYSYLDDVFTSFYHTITFNTAIADSTFETSSHYELVSIPLIAENSQGLKIELFGNFSDPSTRLLSNLSEDQALSGHYSNTQFLNVYSSEFSLGAGISFSTGDNSKIKVIISDSDMPGYGNSNALLGFETSF
ncbi:hypothetical protein [Psychromonas sp. Urea-02u-13]|uniref:hypothetical protein n=1 Tax=Psychromonas sp. Urea-02u-13 TaxID=2058326 RepID=UPI000C343E8F|nr:hypothetical protein [Psychromonas sp. Urea-02u-13]PKG39327.1 hypothetical protein CXF74_09205 [Psychromonas sp. Urea-02u-13]